MIVLVEGTLSDKNHRTKFLVDRYFCVVPWAISATWFNLVHCARVPCLVRVSSSSADDGNIGRGDNSAGHAANMAGTDDVNTATGDVMEAGDVTLDLEAQASVDEAVARTVGRTILG